jgi:hypothetical protein
MQIQVLQGDATRIAVDVLALKYAQARYGLDSFVFERLIQAGHNREETSPLPGEYRLLPSPPGISASNVLFVGTESLWSLGYLEIRVLARSILSALNQALPTTKTLAVTVHGPNYGLDEAESFEAMIAGLVDAVDGGEAPKALEIITFAEINTGRAKRFQSLLAQLLPEGLVQSGHTAERTADSRERLRSVGYASESKSHVFVAMPFSEDFDDVYHYGIQGAVNRCGALCERADLSAFTGDVLSWVRDRIRTASLVIADLTTANSNVYLEVGYAWGCGVPTVLLTRDASDLKFDVRGQRCLTYKRIKDLEEKLATELRNLSDGRFGRPKA